MTDYSRRTYKAGDVIFSQNDRAGEAFMVESGSVRLHAVEGGDTRDIDTLGKGKIFGEMGVVSDMNRMATATAMEDTEVLCCHRREFLRKMDELDEDRRDALRFLIVYNQQLLPFELMDNRPDDEETAARDKIAYFLIRDAVKPGELDDLDMFMKRLYQDLIEYAKRRLPPGFKPKDA